MKKTYLSKILISLSIILILAVITFSINELFYVYKKPKSIELTKAEEIIEEYYLNDYISQKILKKPKLFIEYYESVITNKYIDKELRGFYLNIFDYFYDYEEYIDTKYVFNSIKTFEIYNPDTLDKKDIEEAKKSKIAARTYNTTPKKIEIYSYIDDADYYRILKHETFHIISCFDSFSLNSNVYIEDNKVKLYTNDINTKEIYKNIGSILLEATTELLTNEYSKINTNEVYQNEVLALKILLEIIEPKVLIKAFNKENGVVDVLNELVKIDGDAKNVLKHIELADKTISKSTPVNYFNYYEYLTSLYLKKNNMTSLHRKTSIFMMSYLDKYKYNLYDQSSDQELIDIEEISQNEAFLDYIYDYDELLANHFAKLKDHSRYTFVDVETQKNYFNTSLDSQKIIVYYQDSKDYGNKIYNEEATINEKGELITGSKQF